MVLVKTPHLKYYLLVRMSAGIAQLVEQWIENPRVSSSNLDPGNYVEKHWTLGISLEGYLTLI